LILTGHQPELFHSGVWFKNFVIDSIAKSNAGTAINLVIDSDVARSSGIRVPTASSDGSRVAEILFDAPSAEIPWEEREICDERIFRDFGAEVKRGLAPLLNEQSRQEGLLIDDLWPLAIDEAEREAEALRQFASEHSSGSLAKAFAGSGLRSASLAAALAGARHRLEQKIGLSVRDAALSSICLTDISFQHFVMHLFRRHREFHDVHNAALAEFRRVNHVRSHSHPFPELAKVNEWVEMPLWIWSPDDLRRRRAFVRHRGEQWELSDGESPAPIVHGPLRGHELFAFGETRGIKIRPRALITTMYARLVLSDLFIHGIGGAKYDDLTDLIIRRFFGIEPPAYITATATFRLPIDRPNVSPDEVRQSAQRLRELRYRPESFLREARVKEGAHLSGKLAAFAAEKRTYLDKHDLRRCAQDVFDQLSAMNRAMHDLLRGVEQELRAQHAELVALARQSQLLGSREFSFVLFPSEKLPARLLDLCKGIS